MIRLQATVPTLNILDQDTNEFVHQSRIWTHGLQDE